MDKILVEALNSKPIESFGSEAELCQMFDAESNNLDDWLNPLETD